MTSTGHDRPVASTAHTRSAAPRRNQRRLTKFVPRTANTVSPESSNPENGFALGWLIEKTNAPREGCVSAAKICQLTTYVPVSAALIEADRTAPLATTRPATCAPDGPKTLIPIPAGVTGSL